MGKGSGGAAWWAFLLLAGVLLAAGAAATTTAGTEEDNQDRREDRRPWCKKACEWMYGEDAPRKQECESRCGHKQADGDFAPTAADEMDGNDGAMDTYDDGSCSGRAERECRRQCQSHQYEDQPSQTQQVCMIQCCSHWKRDEEEMEEYESGRDAAVADVDNSSRRQRRCRRQCQQYHEWDKKQQCMRHCHGGGHDAADADEDNSGRGGRWCQRQCQHYHDRDKKQQCMRQCHGSRGDRCQKQCQHYHDWDKKQQCMRHCRHGWETVAGAILAVV